MNNSNKSFFVGLNRAMISLGPLTAHKYCPYSCAFCYVQSDEWGRYTELSNEEILEFLRAEKEKNTFKTIYISGDTDSFAPPRTLRALELLTDILEFNVDVTITTRYAFANDELDKLAAISDLYRKNGLVLSAAISIPRLTSHDYLESANTPSPQKRIEFLSRLKSRGISTILAMRPLLPIISLEEYKQLILECKDYVDAVLGEIWYIDKNKIIENRVLINNEDKNIKFENHLMDFNIGNDLWEAWSDTKLVSELHDYCKSLSLPFFMRSQSALDYIKSKI
jgi:DNA repair photolyase